MNYYQFHVGDYAAHTRNLGLLEDLAYRRMLDAYYVSERPFMGTTQDVAREIGMREHIEDVEYVLNRFFVREGDAWTNKRADSEIVRFREKSEMAAKAGRVSAERRSGGRSTDVGDKQAPVDDEPTDVQLTNNHKPITTTSPKGDVARKRAPTRPDDVPDGVWQDFQAVRKAKRAPLTDTALEGIRREAGKAGISLADAIAYCVERNWVGFNAGWYADRGGVAAKRGHRNSAAARAIFGAPSPEVIDV